jgi:hypothetical protein
MPPSDASDLVCCIHCRVVYAVHDLNSGFHAARCETMWEAQQAEHKRAYDAGQRPSFSVPCSYCSRPVYSLRPFARRACFQCALTRRREAVRQCNRRRRVTERGS